MLDSTTLFPALPRLGRMRMFCVKTAREIENKRVNPPGFKPWKKIVFKCPTRCFVKGEIHHHNFLHVEQALKPGPCIPFLLSHSLTKVKRLP